MAIKKIPNTYVNNNAAWVPLRTVAIKVNEVIDEVNDIIDGEGTETFENIEVTATATIEDIVAVTTQTEDAIVTNILTVDTINEVTANAGVTIDGILIKDSLDGSNIVDKTTTQTISGAKTFSNASGILTDVITERTATAGVTIDSVLLKDGGAVFSDGASIEIDTINEASAGVGVTIDTALIKDGTLLTAVGAVGTPSVQVGSADTGVYQVSGTQTGFAQDGVLVGGFNTTGLFADVISEQTSTIGVTVDGVLLKDGGVSANSMFAGFYPVGAEQALSGPGAINLTSYNTKFTSTGTGDALTLADGSQIGQKKKIMYVAEGAGGDTGVLTLTGYTSITFNAIGDYTILIWNGTAWFVLESVGVTIV